MNLRVQLVENILAEMSSVLGLFLLLDARPKVVTDSGPDLAVDLDVHLLVQLLRELKCNLVDHLSLENVLVELLDVLRKSLNFGIVFEVKSPLLEAFQSEAFLESIAVCLYRLDDLAVLLSEIFNEVLLNLVLDLGVEATLILKLKQEVVIACVYASVFKVKLVEEDVQVFDAVLVFQIELYGFVFAKEVDAYTQAYGYSGIEGNLGPRRAFAHFFN